METDKQKKMYVCTYCKITVTTAATFSYHVMGRKHRARMGHLCTEIVPQIKSFQQFLDTYMKGDSILGLEHVVEVQMGSYLYICHLCAVIMRRKDMLYHLCEMTHMKRYLRRHHPEAFPYTGKIIREINKKIAIRCAAIEIYSWCGSKEMKTLAIADKGPTPAKMAKYVHNENDYPKSSDQYEAEREKWKLLDQSPFTHNDEFFAYMRDFEIRNEEDASFVKIILQDCNNALKIFQPEQANATGVQESPASSHQAPAPTGQADPEHVGYSPKTVDESVPSVSHCAVRSSLEPELAEQSDAKEIFYSSIKNMDASQLHSVFQYIAATQPEFRGMNIPNVIRYLQETGSLKPS